jgi:hypothetical protein
MPLNASGPISIGGSTVGQSINLELNLSATAQSSLNDSALRTLAGAASGQISLSNFWGKSNLGGWSTGGSLPFALSGSKGFGTQNAAASCGGTNSAFTKLAATHLYDGTSWSTTGSLATARSLHCSSGTSQSAGLAYGGSGASSLTSTEAFNGSSWSGGGNLPSTWNFGSGAGTSAAAWTATGEVSGVVANVYNYNGSSWSSRTSLPSGRARSGLGGTQSAGFVVSGWNSTPVRIVETVNWNGVAWVISGNSSSARVNFACAATSVSAGLNFGGLADGNAYSNLTEQYNGFSWTVDSNLPVALQDLGGAGSLTAALSIGGINSSGTKIVNTYEFNK